MSSSATRTLASVISSPALSAALRQSLASAGVANITEPKLLMTSTVVPPSHDAHGVPISENQPGMALLWRTGDREVRMAVKRADNSGGSGSAWTFKDEEASGQEEQVSVVPRSQ
ncbi:hypothetical protein EHS25_007611 [Saitozyma podzolica]|uniref:Uncharacterized protein n=1 Tax=Saitozyma podzolica TaxID=1890683 RepID=A0A427YQB6_9TREE|nr:hypothetical protein EHS25_007611 [Saitozyma podzolica]